MNDDKIVDLYWIRSEDAITETSIKYGKYCYGIAYNILADAEDAEESVNDTYFDAWNTMPPHRPSALSAFLGKLTRRISIDRWRKRSAAKRGGELAAALDELLKNDLLMSISICPSKSELNTLYNWVQENPVRILSFLIKIAASRLRRTLKSSSSVKKRLLKHVMLKTVLSN